MVDQRQPPVQIPYGLRLRLEMRIDPPRPERIGAEQETHRHDRQDRSAGPSRSSCYSVARVEPGLGS
ncbi:hypothetical protein [Sphaerisporangium flaviroseum]|uniref:hypothetical protein n=1 Tax=Sphaerisporangium flaviroseum TaxID=509199 RepID=UPI0031EF095A